MDTERVVVMLQNVFKTADRAEPDVQRTLAKLVSFFAGSGDSRPAWLTAESMARMVERLRRVQGQWRATRFHETMELKFP
jgi:transposase